MFVVFCIERRRDSSKHPTDRETFENVSEFGGPTTNSLLVNLLKFVVGKHRRWIVDYRLTGVIFTHITALDGYV